MRLVSEQRDGNARGWWEADHFLLATKLSRRELEQWFLYEYEPTPLVSPWNKGAGFFFEKDRGVYPLEQSKGNRFAKFREGIRDSRAHIEELAKADRKVRDIKAETKLRGMSSTEKNKIRSSEDYKGRLREAEKAYKDLKEKLIPRLRLKWRGAHSEWLDAATRLLSDGTPKYPALLGTGGNDGRLDFTNIFMQVLGAVFDLGSSDGAPKSRSAAWLAGALWGIPVPKIIGQPVGQYMPGTAGGANNSNSTESGSIVNPLDFILMLEGSIAFASHTTRRLGSTETSRISSPFAVSSCGAAYSSASPSDEAPRGEQWMPLWIHPSTFAELRQLMAEGRAQLGAKTAQEPLDMALAIRRLGAARGIGAFQRYGYLERNGQSNLAVSLGRFDVGGGQSGDLVCMDDIDKWRRQLRKEARAKNVPKHMVASEKRLVDELFAVIRHSSPLGWQRVLLRLAEIEMSMVRGSGFTAQPIPALRPEWATVSNDGTVEFRLAVAFALQSSKYATRNSGADGHVRRHWLPLDAKSTRQNAQFAMTGTGAAARLDIRPEVVIQGHRGVDDAIAVMKRCLAESSQQSRRLPLDAAPNAAAHMTDIAALISGRVNVDRTINLARPLMALDRKKWAVQEPLNQPSVREWPDDAWIAIRLCTLPWKIETRSGFELDIGVDPALIRRLAAGDAASAVGLALRRLGASGVRCTVRSATVHSYMSRLWAAALAFPITKDTAKEFLYRLDPSKK